MNLLYFETISGQVIDSSESSFSVLAIVSVRLGSNELLAIKTGFLSCHLTTDIWLQA